MEEAATRVHEPAPTQGRDRAAIWRRIRYAVIAGWLVVLVMLPLSAERKAQWHDVRDLVASGQVQAVEIDNEVPADGVGSALVMIHWHHGVLDYVTIVRQYRGHDGDNEDGDVYDDEDVTATLHAAPSARLLALQPGLDITRGHHHGVYDQELLGFATDLWLGVVTAVLWLATLVLLMAGPEPWRATRWAWFWWFQNPVGVAAFLLLSGPLPGMPKPRAPERRLTGGWSFLLVMVFSTVSVTIPYLTG